MALNRADVEQHRIRQTDADGTLTQAGFWWREPRPIVSPVIWGVIGILTGAGGLAVIGGLVMLFRLDASLLFFLPVMAIAVWAAIWANRVPWHFMWWRKTVIFRVDGKVLFESYPSNLRLYDARTPPALEVGAYEVKEIASIEMQAEPKPLSRNHWVVFYFGDGQAQLVAAVPEYYARLIVVQLTQALNEMRASMAAQAQPEPEEEDQ